MPIDAKLLAAGARWERQGDFQQARDLYQSLLAEHGAQAPLLVRLATACLALGDHQQAAFRLDEALRLDPQLAEAHGVLGRLRAAEGRFGDAAASFERAAALDPRGVDVRLAWADALESAGQINAAIEVLSRLVGQAPDNIAAHKSLARLLTAAGRDDAAAAALRRVTELVPDSARAQVALAAARSRLGHKQQAAAAYQAALRLDPRSADVTTRLAIVYADLKLYDEAAHWARRAIELDDQLAEAHHTLGLALLKQQRYQEALGPLQTAARLKPQLKQAHVNLGVAEAGLDRFAAAIVHYRRALELDPRDVTALFDLGNAAIKTGELGLALESFERAIAVRPESGEAHFNRGVLLLQQGRYPEGFREFEWRLRLNDDFDPAGPAGTLHAAPRLADGRPLPWSIWQGEPLEGRTIVIYHEGGLGDTLQFVRFAGELKRRGARVAVLCARALLPLLSGTPGVDVWLTPENAELVADYSVPMMSLPHRLGITVDTVPAPVHLIADPQRVEHWRSRLAELGDALKVGILWQGNRQMLWDRYRSLALEHFAPLSRVAGVRLVNLQKGPGIEQLDAVRESWNVADYSAEADRDGAFLDTAAIIKNLDVVVTCDSATEHVAAAMGVTTWIALNFIADWRWMLARDDSPWYPSVRLFRQPRFDDWRSAFEAMAAELERMVARRSASGPRGPSF